MIIIMIKVKMIFRGGYFLMFSNVVTNACVILTVYKLYIYIYSLGVISYDSVDESSCTSLTSGFLVHLKSKLRLNLPDNGMPNNQIF